MKITALFLVRNEERFLSHSLAAALRWCDAVDVLDHASTDGTADIVRAYPPSVVRYEREDNPEWAEMDFRHRMGTGAAMRGATHLALVDADEIPTGNLLPKLRGFAADLQPGYSLVLPQVACWRGLGRFRCDTSSPYGRGVISLLIACHPGLDGWGAAKDGYQHHARAPKGVRGQFQPYRRPSQGGVFHLQWIEWDRLLVKQARYILRDIVAYPGREPLERTLERYRPAIDEAGLETAPVPPEWWEPYGGPPALAPAAAPPWFYEDGRRLWGLAPPTVRAALPPWVGAALGASGPGATLPV